LTIYLSTNSGSTWAPTVLPAENWLCVASSANGETLFAGAHDTLFISTNSGRTWATNYISDNFTLEVACSADGSTVTVATGGGKQVLYSTNFGSTFTSNSVPGDGFCSTVCSADGKILTGMYPSQISVGGSFPIYRSTNFGATWAQTSAALQNYFGLASSADGKILVASGEYGILISTNSGLTWATNNSQRVFSVACSADGTRFVGVQGSNGRDITGVVMTSLDYGKTWVTNDAPVTDWTGVCMSADGSFMAASAYGYDTNESGIFTTEIPAQPSLKIAAIGSNLTLSWPLPSAGFVLQENSNFNSSGWVNVTNAVTQCGYYNQVTVSPPQSGNTFYRLVNE
jgi:hypothetical protein